VSAVSNASSPSSACKKKLFKFRPSVSTSVQTYATKKQRRDRPGDPATIEQGVRQTLADRVSGNLVGLWLLLPEHLRLGTWDLLCGWTQQHATRVEPRLALQLVHESALCLTGLRDQRGLRQRGFELANGLPFVATDTAIHFLLNDHTIAQAMNLQIALGKLRRASGQILGRLLIVDPHRLRSHSKRRMRRHKKDQHTRATNVAQTFFCLDGETKQPIGFVTGTSSRTVTQATPELLDLAAAVCGPQTGGALALADAEHFTAALLDQVHQDTRFDILVPIPLTAKLQRRLHSLPDEQFTRHWAGYATAKLPYQLTHSQQGPFFQFVQRLGESPAQYHYNAFLSTCDRDPVQALTAEYPKRWHIEEFFNIDQGLGWDRAGTQNLHIRYGHMSLSLIAQAVIAQLRQRLGPPASAWNCRTIAEKLLAGLEGDIRVENSTIIVTYYNAPEADRLRLLYGDLPAKLAAENIDPRIPWLYDFKLDCRFR
jgi:Transposase DDE domain